MITKRNMGPRYLNIKERLRKHPNYKYYFFEKALSRLILSLYNLCSFPLRLVILGRVHITTQIALNSSFRNFKNIKLSKHAEITKGVVLWAGHENGIEIGEHTQINPYTTVYGNVTIGKFVMVAPHVMLAGGGHDFSNRSIPMKLQPSTSKGGIVIGDDVWIGANSVILDGVHISSGAIIAAGSVVTTSVGPYEIHAGIPARKINTRVI